MTRLPIEAVLPELMDTIDTVGTAVLIAPPGAGKTTAVAPALIRQAWCDGMVILLSPRRVAARAAAERMAQTLGEKPGETVGYLTRMDSRQSNATRILVMTEAIFVNRIVEDAELPGVSAILFDEAHERHLDSDLGLALALESRAVLRPDLRICVMSATIDGQRFADLLGKETRVIQSAGKAYPLRLEWLGSRGEVPFESRMADAVLTAWRAETGDILAFCPGVREIGRVQATLERALPDVPILPLHGQVEAAAQRSAIRRDTQGRRRIVLATAIAETSLTLDGVSVVVDGGLSRRAVFDHTAGTTQLVTRRSSQASADQRAGRAARQGPGVAYRLWEAAGHAGRAAFDAPEMQTADLAPTMLTVARWGSDNIAEMAWLDPPPAATIESAIQRLVGMGALEPGSGDRHTITPWGRKIASLPIDPASAAAVLHGAQAGLAEDTARFVLLLQERGLGGPGEDLHARLIRWNADRSPRAAASRKLTARWARLAERAVDSEAASEMTDPAIAMALALPDNVAKRRGTAGDAWVSAGGRGYILDPASPLSTSEWLVIGHAQGQAKGARILAAARLDPAAVDAHLGHLVERRSIVRWNTQEERVEARLERRFGAITMARGPDPAPDAAAVAAALNDAALERLDRLLPKDVMARARFAGIDALLPDRLRDTAELWLFPMLEGRRDLQLAPSRMTEAILGQLDWETRRRLNTRTPIHFESPAGTRETIDYVGEGAPAIAIRVQALFGLDRHPMIGDTPLLLQLTSPAGRPIQATRDLPGFWRGSWHEVAKAMKGRYPKHRWPDQPWLERPSLKTKNALNRSG
ncbi:MAG: ATP-dependent helicase HrpB [Pontixanthobacter sp.]